jgi:competence protein ComGC
MKFLVFVYALLLLVLVANIDKQVREINTTIEQSR